MVKLHVDDDVLNRFNMKLRSNQRIMEPGEIDVTSVSTALVISFLDAHEMSTHAYNHVLLFYTDSRNLYTMTSVFFVD